MSEPTRLRRLDALFAEKVLGSVIVGDMVTGEPLVAYPNQQTTIVTMGFPLSHYTRSLDAAWEGVKFGMVSHSDNPSLPKFVARVSTLAREDDPRQQFRNGEGRADDHPAEALVLACLRAVGCTEDELA